MASGLEAKLTSPKHNLMCYCCLDSYKSVDNAKKPVTICSELHTLCGQCYDEQKDNIKTCGICRKDINFDKNTTPYNRLVIEKIETLVRRWIKKHPNDEQAKVFLASSSTQPSISAMPVIALPSTSRIPEIVIPANFKCKSFAETICNEIDVGLAIEEANPSILKTMGWDRPDVVSEYQQDFFTGKKRWVLVSNPHGETIGTASLKQLQDVGFHWQMDWAGVLEKDINHYIELYKSILLHIKSQYIHMQNTLHLHNFHIDNSDRWRLASLTSYLNFDTEYSWLDNIKITLIGLNLRFDWVHEYRSWGTMVKITTYPFDKSGHEQISNPIETEMIVRSHTEDQMEKKMKRYLIHYGLDSLFNSSCGDGRRSEEVAEYLLTQFINKPENFFVYIVDSKAEGFMQFSRLKGCVLDVERCFLTNKAQENGYSGHFIQQFREWATTKPIFEKGTPAQSLNFGPGCTQMEPLKQAINLYAYL